MDISGGGGLFDFGFAPDSSPSPQTATAAVAVVAATAQNAYSVVYGSRGPMPPVLSFEGQFGGVGFFDFGLASDVIGPQIATTLPATAVATAYAPYSPQGGTTPATSVLPEPLAPCVVEVAEVPLCFPSGGNVRLGTLGEVARPMGRESVDRDEWLSCEVPVASDGYPLLRPRRILRIVTSHSTGPGAYYEARIGRIEVIETPDGAVARVTARGLTNDLIDCGPVSLGGLYTFATTKSPEQWLDDVILPTLAAAGFGYVARGTIEFTGNLSRSVNWETPYELMNWLAEETRGEWYLRRNGASDYRLDLVVIYGSSAPTGYLVAGTHIATVASDADDGTQGTHILPKGDGAVEALRVSSWALWKVSAKSSTRITLASPSGATGQLPISADDQFNGWIAVSLRTAERFTVTDSFYDSQEVAISPTTNFAVGDFVYFLASAVGAITVPVISGEVATAYGVTAYRATGVAGNSFVLVNDNSDLEQPAQAITDESGWSLIGATVKAYAPGATGTGYSGISTLIPDSRWRLTVTSSAGVSVGDVMLQSAGGGTPPYYSNRQWYVVVAVPDGTTIDIERLYAAALGPTPLSVATLLFWSPRAGSTTVTGVAAATETVTVANAAAANIATNDVVMFSRVVGGTPIGVLPHVAAADYYDARKTRVYAADLPGGNLFTSDQNAWLRNWTGASPSWVPIGWSRALAGSTGRIADTTAYGPYAAQFSGTQRLLTGRTRLDPACRYWAVVLEGATFADQGGAVRVGFQSTHEMPNIVTTSVGNASVGITTGTVTVIVDLQAAYNENDYAKLHDAVTAMVWTDATTGNAGATVRALGVIPLPDGVPIPQYALPEVNMGSQVWSKANIWLQAHAYTPTSYEVGIADLERIDPTTYANARLSLGGTVRVVAGSAGVDSSLRVVAIERNFTVRADSRVTLANQLVTITRLLGGSV